MGDIQTFKQFPRLHLHPTEVAGVLLPTLFHMLERELGSQATSWSVRSSTDSKKTFLNEGDSRLAGTVKKTQLKPLSASHLLIGYAGHNPFLMVFPGNEGREGGLTRRPAGRPDHLALVRGNPRTVVHLAVRADLLLERLRRLRGRSDLPGED
jgi:hypothetical protein